MAKVKPMDSRMLKDSSLGKQKPMDSMMLMGSRKPTGSNSVKSRVTGRPMGSSSERLKAKLMPRGSSLGKRTPMGS